MNPQEQLKIQKKLALEPIPAKAAIEEIETYRSMLTQNGHGVWYYAADIKKYIDEDFPIFVATHKNSGEEFVWVVGYYFKIHNGRLSFCLIPTEYNRNTGEIIDRISKEKIKCIPAIYPLNTEPTPMSKEPTDPPGDGEVYDKGDMWP